LLEPRTLRERKNTALLAPRPPLARISIRALLEKQSVTQTIQRSFCLFRPTHRLQACASRGFI
jgi:hypothetical protein